MPRSSSRASLCRRSFLASAAASVLAAPALRAHQGGLRFTHAYGETVLPAPARRVVSLGYTGQDMLLALGLAPIAVRYWYGDHPFGVWPWAQPYLGDARPALITGEVSLERVADLAPDLILAAGSGISRAEYEVLSRIAPVLMHDPRHSPYGTPWDVETRIVGRAIGREDLAEERIAGVHAAFAAARARHPDWAGRTAVAAYQDGGQTGAFAGEDTRARFLAALGFRPPEALGRLPLISGFYTQLSPEDLSPIDADLLIWISSLARAPDIAGLAMRRTLRAFAQGRELFVDELIAGALSFGSVLSLPFALKALEADIAIALDGRPGTPVASSVAAGIAP
ncbi:ABC transporter substrate-binding protein [Cereibacter sphaeroides]|uniref:ABC transporter substrate-binding protein n=1 Tax=Cereibacter sphaeroides TaxID=1063 RepID=UPI001F2F18A9|nr:ABC transporter substrate-binding protein [Cereibacter sphaeroides]MCE6960821.1 ABC transporter substrate-binding protein [Cereibacter sphaeroides]MCE6969913.1 ABC transporter substrate-binding protein [Cereibacter sphaeroides]MCE6974301.1 ABC transporter substrate-binding protein [Cereibacter sphaeroides]